MEQNKVLYLYNDLAEKAVKLVLKDGDYIATVKHPWGEEVSANYDKSEICGDAFAYGDVMTEEEYNKFPEGVELSDMTKADIEAVKNGEWDDE